MNLFARLIKESCNFIKLSIVRDYTLNNQKQSIKGSCTMKSITQIQHEFNGQTLISNFFRLIGLGKICKAVNFNRSSSVSLASIIAWLFEARFNLYSMYRAKESVNFTSRTARNVMNDGRINWQKLVCLASSKIMSALAPFIDKRSILITEGINCSFFPLEVRTFPRLLFYFKYFPPE